MTVKHFVFVSHNGSTETVPLMATMPHWILRDGKAFQREGHACALCSNDEQETALVYIQRPFELYNDERARLVRHLEMDTRNLAEMPLREV